MEMDERKMRILQAIIDDYVLTGVPVGSRTISRKYDMGLSSATIRNEMSDLEELGFLDQPHVSAGRIPSAKAYRLYVDTLLQTGKIRDDNEETIKKRLDVYHNQTSPLIEWYKNEGIHYHINGLGELDRIFGDICKVIDNL